MANEVSYRVELEFNDAAGKPRMFSGTKQVTLDPASVFAFNKVSVGTSAEAIALGDVSTPSLIIAHNHDETNYVEIGHDVSAAFEADVKLLAGDWCLFRCAQGAPQMRANTGACIVSYLVLE